MDCFSILFLFFLLIGGIVQFVQWVRRKSLESSIRKAWEEKNYSEYSRLCDIRYDRQMKARQAEISNQSNQRYLDRIFVLDAAEHGVFAPGAERVFDDEEDRSSYRQEEYYEDEDPYYESDSYDDSIDD